MKIRTVLPVTPAVWSRITTYSRQTKCPEQMHAESCSRNGATFSTTRANFHIFQQISQRKLKILQFVIRFHVLTFGTRACHFQLPASY